MSGRNIPSIMKLREADIDEGTKLPSRPDASADGSGGSIREELHLYRRERILSVAAELFSQKGYSGVSVNELAAMIGVTKPFIYYYVKNKQDILEQICIATIDLPHLVMDGLSLHVRAPLRLGPGYESELRFRFLSRGIEPVARSAAVCDRAAQGVRRTPRRAFAQRCRSGGFPHNRRAGYGARDCRDDLLDIQLVPARGAVVARRDIAALCGSDA
jgi:AcrR family transcriptional regulator